MYKFSIYFFLAMMSMIAIGYATNPVPHYILQSVPDAGIVGEGRMTYMMMDIYDARLYAPQGKFEKSRPFALSLTYLRTLNGARIAEKSIEEIRSQGFNNEITLTGWYGDLRRILPDVHEGVTLTGLLTEDGRTVFYQNGHEIGRINDAQFGKYFFSIWLGPDTSEMSLRDSLLAASDEGL